MAQHQFFFLPAFHDHSTRIWQPPIDVYRHAAGWLVKCDLAGVRPQDICISVAGRQLTIAGVRRDCSLVESAEVYSMEITDELEFVLVQRLEEALNAAVPELSLALVQRV